MPSTITLADIEAAERDAHAAISATIARADGLDATAKEARIVGLQFSDDSAQINAALDERK